MKTQSDITGLFYEDEDCVFFRNCVQSAFYIFKGAKLVDIFVDDKMKIVFVFKREDHKRLIKDWIEHKARREAETDGVQKIRD